MNETAQSRQPMKPVLRPLRFRRFSTVQLLIALALLFTCAPFVEEIKGGDLIISLLLSLVLLSAVLAVADRKHVLVIALVLAIPAVALFVVKPARSRPSYRAYGAANSRQIRIYFSSRCSADPGAE